MSTQEVRLVNLHNQLKIHGLGFMKTKICPQGSRVLFNADVYINIFTWHNFRDR